MIGKITNQNQIARHKLANKINELVDAVNEMQCWHKNLPRFWQDLSQVENTVDNKEPVDPYAEQRKWIGKLCRFSYNPEGKCRFGILERIYKDSRYPFFDSENLEWAICEPVKPDDDVIYKGGDNE